jgi:hypothetical protein
MTNTGEISTTEIIKEIENNLDFKNIDNLIENYETIVQVLDMVDEPTNKQIEYFENQIKCLDVVKRHNNRPVVELLLKVKRKIEEMVLIDELKIKTEKFNYTYCKPRKTWETSELLKLAKKHPEILECRNISEPSFRLTERKVQAIEEVKEEEKKEPTIFD